ncbi:DUF6221 family protein [Nocardia sp. NPDC049149]|uniref:DUF6221 family protein n=1 Tax=Nocardia sp. NPDC049149 TaxID=3364315 RepID=UPI00371DEB63
MSAEDVLARLTAGLAEDEQVAHGAWKEGAVRGDEWIVRKLQGGLFDGGIYVCDAQSPPQGDDIIQTRDGETGHIERHAPARTLRQTEALRDAIEWLTELAEFDDCDWPGVASRATGALSALARIYTTEETS